MPLYQELKLINCRAVLAEKWASLGKIKKQVLIHSEIYLSGQMTFQLNRERHGLFKKLYGIAFSLISYHL